MGAKRADNETTTTPDPLAPKGNPSWYVPVMLGLMIIGLLWVVVHYLTQGEFPVKAWGNWNLVAGFGFIIAGFLMTTNWR